jgi:hypothetical protein
MYAVRQIQQVENGKVVVQLPADFSATRVEVIILPAESVSQTGSGSSPSEDEQGKAAIQHFLTMDTSHFTEEQRKAYERTAEILRKGRKPNEPRIPDLFAGLVQVASDFNEPLPDDLLRYFEGDNDDESVSDKTP